MDFLSRHVMGDWGEIPEEDRVLTSIDVFSIT
jgi:hypothetical protein